MRKRYWIPCVVPFLFACSGGTDSPSEKTPASTTTEVSKTLLESVQLEPDHYVEFHQLASGMIGVHETGRSNTRPRVKSLLPNGLVSLADTYQKIRPGAQVPDKLVGADAHQAVVLAGMREQQAKTELQARIHPDVAAIHTPRPEMMVPPSVGQRPRFYTDADQAWFKSNFCDPNGVDQCLQGYGSVDTGYVQADILYWESWGYMDSDSPGPGTHFGTHLVYTGIVAEAESDFENPLPPDWWDYWIYYAVPYIGGPTSYVRTGILWAPASAQLSAALKLTTCGALGQGTCVNNTCEKPATPVQGQCVGIQTQSWNCGGLGTGGVSGDTKLGLSNTGDWSFGGDAHNGGPIVMDYTLGVATTATDSQGRQFGQVHGGTIHGWADSLFGSQDDHFTDTGFDPSIADAWNNIASGGMNCNLHVSPNGWLTGADALAGLGLVAVGAAVVVSGHGISNAKCHWGDPNQGQGYICEW